MKALMEIIYSLPFIIGFFAGLIGMRIYQQVWCHYQNKHHPHPDGTPHKVGRISPRAVGALIVLGVTAYVLVQVKETEQHYIELGNEMWRCQAEFLDTMNTRTQITTENDRVSAEQRELLGEIQNLQTTWIERLMDPPPELEGSSLTDQRRVDYTRTVTRLYYDRITTLLKQVNQLNDHQLELERARADNPLPPPTCPRP